MKRQILLLRDVTPSGGYPCRRGDIYNGTYDSKRASVTLWFDGFNGTIHRKNDRSCKPIYLILPEDWDEEYLFELSLTLSMTFSKKYLRR
jgi:hypothetical protein